MSGWLNIFYNDYLIVQEKDLPAVEKLVYSTSYGSSHEERGRFKLKVKGTQIYVTISDGLVGLEVSDRGDDVDRFSK